MQGWEKVEWRKRKQAAESKIIETGEAQGGAVGVGFNLSPVR